MSCPPRPAITAHRSASPAPPTLQLIWSQIARDICPAKPRIPLLIRHNSWFAPRIYLAQNNKQPNLQMQQNGSLSPKNEYSATISTYTIKTQQNSSLSPKNESSATHNKNN